MTPGAVPFVLSFLALPDARPQAYCYSVSVVKAPTDTPLQVPDDR
jgi:hypothetical protein